MVFGPWVSNVRRWSCDTWIYELCLRKIFLLEWLFERTPGFAFYFVTFCDPTHFTRCLLCSLITKNSLLIFNHLRTFCSIFQWNQSKNVENALLLLAFTSRITHIMADTYMRASVSVCARVRHVLSAIHWPPHFFFFSFFSIHSSIYLIDWFIAVVITHYALRCGTSNSSPHAKLKEEKKTMWSNSFLNRCIYNFGIYQMDGSISIIEMQNKAIHVESQLTMNAMWCDEKQQKREIGKD